MKAIDFIFGLIAFCFAMVWLTCIFIIEISMALIYDLFDFLKKLFKGKIK